MALLQLTDECLAAAEGNFPEPEILPNGRKAKPPMRMQVFKNEFIEKWFAQAHPITPGVLFGLPTIYGLYLGWTQFRFLGLALFAAGILIVTLIEYFLHRYAFHMNATNQAERLNLFLMHGYHHEYPNDPMRLVLPPIAIIPVAVIIGTLYYFVFQQYWLVIFGGSSLGYIAYDWVHYYTHHFNPKSGVLRFIKRYHMLHHHDSPNHRYGITSPLWDLVFGTYLPLKKMVREAHVRQATAVGHGPKSEAPASNASSSGEQVHSS